MRKRNLGERLESIIELIGSCDAVYDIGCDHGYMSIELAQRGFAGRIFFSDISAMALEKARVHAREAGLDGIATFAVADGLGDAAPTEKDAVCISGMGGHAVADILESAGVTLPCKVIIQANTEVGVLRGRLEMLGYEIEDERIVYERGRYYQIMRLAGKVAGKMRLTETQRLLGPVLLEKKSAVLLKYVERRIALLEKALYGAKADEEDAAAITHELELMKEARGWIVQSGT